MRSPPRALKGLLLLLFVGAALAMPSAPTPPAPSPTPTPTPAPTQPTFDQYRRQLESNSYADVYYEVYRCTRIALGQYTTVVARAITDSSPHKSRYLAHNVMLRINGRLINRSSDIEVQVSRPSETNFITSIPAASVQMSMSCPEAFLATFVAQGWHKGISLHGHGHSFHTSKAFYG
jgi:hypothetical protein